MASGPRVHLCRFDSASDLRGKKRTYEAVKEAVLRAGRFSTFEASNTPRDVALFTQLSHDPEVEVFNLGYPWHGIRRRPAKKPKAKKP